MKNRRNVNAPPTADLVQYYIDSAYDNVKLVADNLDLLIPLAEALEAGELDNFLQTTDIDTLVELNTILTDATLTDIADQATAAQGALADTAIQGPFASAGEAIGGVDNTHAMTALRVAQAIETFADTKQNNYAGTVDPSVTDDTNAGYSVGSVWINNTAVPPESFRCADAAVGAAVWLKTTLTSDEMAVVALTGNSDDLIEGVSKLLMTAIERSKLSGIEDNATADQTGAEIKAAYEAEADTNAYTDAEKTKLAGVETGATADQSNAEIASGYNTVTPIVSQVAAEAGTSTTAERWTPERVAQAIAALGGGGGGGGGMAALYKDSNYTLVANDLIYSEAGLTHTLPAAPTIGDKCSVWDVSDNAATNAITITDGVNSWSINMNGGRFDFMFNGFVWLYSYVVQTIQPSTVVTRQERKYFTPDNGLINWTATGPSQSTVGAETNYKLITMDHTSQDFVAINTQLSKYWNMAPTIKVRVYWKVPTTATGDVEFYFRPARAISNDESQAIAPVGATLILLDTSLGVVDNLYISDWLTLDVEGVSSVDQLIAIDMYRYGPNATDTLADSISLLGIEIEYATEETLTAAVSNDPNTVSRDMTGITDTLLASDAGKVIYASNAVAQDLGIPDGLPIGTQFILAWEGVGEPSVSMDGTETIVGDTAPAAQYKRLHVEKRSATVWWGTG
jgi:hypothetical protein